MRKYHFVNLYNFYKGLLTLKTYGLSWKDHPVILTTQEGNTVIKTC